MWQYYGIISNGLGMIQYLTLKVKYFAEKAATVVIMRVLRKHHSQNQSLFCYDGYFNLTDTNIYTCDIMRYILYHISRQFLHL